MVSEGSQPPSEVGISMPILLLSNVRFGEVKVT